MWVRYYSCIYSVDYPKIQEVAQGMEEHVYGHYGQIGYILPEKRFHYCPRKSVNISTSDIL